jgi:hypothetical protein
MQARFVLFCNLYARSVAIVTVNRHRGAGSYIPISKRNRRAKARDGSATCDPRTCQPSGFVFVAAGIGQPPDPNRTGAATARRRGPIWWRPAGTFEHYTSLCWSD